MLVEQVIEKVWDLIQSERLEPGERLPSERDMANSLGISRPTLRAALKFLSDMGLVRIRRGAGVFVASSPPFFEAGSLRMLGALRSLTLDEILTVRRFIEIGLAGLAASNVDGDQLAALAEAVTEMYVSLQSPEQFLTHDAEFHRALGAAAGNNTLATLMEMVTALISERQHEIVGTEQSLRRSVEMHRKIYEAIRTRNSDAARTAMGNHFKIR